MNKEKLESKYKSCSTCKNSAFSEFQDNDTPPERIGFHIINSGCHDCKNYNKWVFDKLGMRERFKQERI